eukprot:m.610900 g.610900  ORF g.610900 m.610900 type:complete len:184 (-) comp22495_c0_seq20:2530-3081(-)
MGNASVTLRVKNEAQLSLIAEIHWGKGHKDRISLKGNGYSKVVSGYPKAAELTCSVRFDNGDIISFTLKDVDLRHNQVDITVQATYVSVNGYTRGEHQPSVQNNPATNILVTSNSGQQALPQPHRPVEPRRTIPHVQINQQLAVWASSTVTAQPQIHQLTWSEIEQRFNYSFSLERETLALST